MTNHTVDKAALVETLTGAAQRLNAACDAMWNDHRRVEAHRIKECHMKAISEAQQALFPALEAAKAAAQADYAARVIAKLETVRQIRAEEE